MNLALEQRAFALLREALDLDAASRDAFVAARCDGDAALLSLVRALLREDGAGVLDGDVAQLAARLVPDDDLAAGAMLGPWRVVSELGRGGMGAVYLAERAGDGFAQRAAVKLIKRGMDTGEVLARFRRERQILARLAHPNVARLLDGGMAEDGRPWLAMEYIDGERLDHWAARATVDLAARIALVLRLADALAHAHRQLVVHRDLKPSNVLVDAQGEPHLLDFGIARLLEGDDAHERTATSARFLTRAYAAPEQLRGEAASTAADVWQLGVLLFELTCGARFHDHPNAQSGKPSQRLAQAREASGDAGPAAVPPRALRGDLGVIVSRATDADPARRYASVDAFADDLRRWRERRPILARADSAGYRLRRFVARHRFGAAAAATTLFAIVAGAGAALWQAHAASLATQRAEAVNAFLEGIFRSIEPDNARGRVVTARELVDKAASRLGAELAAQPQAEAQLRNVLGTTYLVLGDYAAAETQYRAALPLFAPEQAKLAVDTRHSLAQIAQQTGRFDAARTLLDEAEALRLASLPRDLDLRDLIAQETATLELALGDVDKAVTMGRQVLAARRERLGADDPATLDSAQSLAVSLKAAGEPAEALRLIEQVIDARRRVDGDDAPSLASPLFNRAAFKSDAGDYAGALASIDECLALRRRILPPDHLDIARTLGRKALDLQELGRTAEALALWPEAIRILRAPAQPDRGLLAQELNNWGVNCYRAGDLDCAVARIEEALALWQADLPPDHAYLMTARSNLAALETSRGRLHEGETQLRAVLARREAALAAGDDSADQVGGWLSTLSALIANLRFQGRQADALPFARAALARAEADHSAPRLDRSIARGDLAAVLADAGDCAAAEPLARSTLEEATALAPAGGLQRAFALQDIGRCALRRNDADEARQHLADAVAAFTEAGNADHWRTQLARGLLGRAQLAAGRRDEARTNLDAAIARLGTQRPWLPDLAQLRAARAQLGR